MGALSGPWCWVVRGRGAGTNLRDGVALASQWDLALAVVPDCRSPRLFIERTNPAAVPAQVSPVGSASTSRIYYRANYGLGAGVGRDRGVGPNLGVGVGLGVVVALGVAVGVTLGVAVAVPVGVAVALGVAVGVPVGVAVALGVAVGVPVGVAVGVVVAVGVAVAVGVGVVVGVPVGVGVGVTPASVIVRIALGPSPLTDA
jgi:hypothetical protein